MNKAACVLIAMVSLIGVGCRAKPTAGTSPPTRPLVMRPIALVNVNRVITAMGWDHDVQQAMEVADYHFRTDLNDQLLKLATQASDVRSQVAKQAHLDADQTLQLQNAKNLNDIYALPLTADERQLLVTTGIQAALAMGQARQHYQQQLHDRLLELAGAYRQRIMPMAQRVAAKSGFRIVLADDPSIVYHDPAIDVSNQVIDELNQARPSWERP